DECVTVALGTRTQVGEIAAGARLAEELATGILTPQQGTEVPRSLIVIAVGEEQCTDHADGRGQEPGRHVEARHLLVEDDLLPDTASATAARRRPRDAGPTVVEAGLLPTATTIEVLAFGERRVIGRAVRPVT